MTTGLLFTRRHDWVSPLIRLATWGEWSHVDLIDQKTNTVVGASRNGGVIELPVKERIAQASKAAILTLGGVPDGRIIEFVRSNIGAGYDWPGIFGLFFRKRLENPEKYFCSELIAWAFWRSGHPVIKAGDEWKVTPQYLWQVGGLGKVHVVREYVK